MSSDAEDAGYDEWLDAVEADEGHYLACPEGHGSLPPRRTCPHCGAAELTKEPLPDVGEVETYAVVHVTTPSFVDDAPYVSAIAGFGPVRLTGVLDTDPGDAAVGTAVEVGVETNAGGRRTVIFRPR